MVRVIYKDKESYTAHTMPLKRKLKSFFRSKKLPFKMTLVLITFLVVFLSLHSVIFLVLYKQSLKGLSNDFDENSLGVYTRLLSVPLIEEDYERIGEYVRAMQSYPQVLSAKVINQRGESVSNMTTRLSSDTPGSEIKQKDIAYNRQNIGRLEVTLSTRYLDIQVQQYSIAIIVSLIFFILLVTSLMVFTIRIFILKPMHRLVKSVQKVSYTNQDERVPVESQDEIGLFAESFNNVLSELQKNVFLTHTILESLPFTWVAFDEDYKILQCNNFIRNYWNLDKDGNSTDSHLYSTPKDIIGTVLWEAIPFFIRYQQSLQTVKSVNKLIKIPREQVKQRYIQVQIFPLTECHSYAIRLDDVTDEEIKDSQLRQSLKIESLGVLASGLAHDFNNVLSGVSSVVSILKYKLQTKSVISTEKLSDIVDIIDLAASRASDMVRQMLMLSRKQEMNFVTVDLNTCLANVIRICKNSIDKSVKIDIIYYPEKALTLADANQLESVFLNIAINAWHAMTIMKAEDDIKGGTLTIKLEQVDNDKFIQHQNTDQSYIEKYWLISISDTGVGISPENLKKIYDPFFTTKDKGKGTGLGLSMVSNIVSLHNGFIDITSEVGVGTKFMIYLPAVLPKELTIQSISDDKPFLKGNGEIILYVDDEKIVREVTSQLFDELNYKYIMAESGREAIKIYGRERSKISLVILDMSMPELSGPQTLEELKKINPNVVAILCSGFAMAENEASITSTGFKAFLEKPFTLMKLSKVVWDVMHPE